MPILRLEVCHLSPINVRRIRRQSERPNNVSGRPDQLYEDRNSGKRLSFRHNLDLLRQLATHLCGFDYDACLTPETTAFFSKRCAKSMKKVVSSLGRVAICRTAMLARY